MFDLSGFILSFFVSLKSYAIVGSLLVDNFSLPTGIANAVGFLLAGFLAQTLFSYGAFFIYKKFILHIFNPFDQKKKNMLRFVNNVLGAITALGEAAIFIAFMLTLLVALPVAGRIKKDIVSSKIGGVFVSKTQGIEHQLNAIFGTAVNETLTFITINPNPSSNERVNLHFTQSEIRIDENAERTMLELMNEERGKEGLGKLTLSVSLRTLSRAYATDMFARGYFSHFNPEGESPFDRMDKAKISYTAAGENLALAPNVTLAHQGLMNSPGHRANILSPDYGKVGIGVIDGGIYGEMFVQEFTD